MDLSLSPAGTQVITSYMYLEQGMLKNRIVFYNFGLGKDDARRVVGGFQPQDLADAMAGRVRFLDESHAVIFTDKGLQFFSTRVETSPESVSQVLFDENVRSIAWSETYVGVVTDNAQGEDPYRLRIYQADGTERRCLTGHSIFSIRDLTLTEIWFCCTMILPAVSTIWQERKNLTEPLISLYRRCRRGASHRRFW